MKKRFSFAGIKKLYIPISADEITIESIKKYLPNILRVHAANARKIKYYQEYVDGTFQDIDLKSRKFEKADEHNNNIKQNHAFALVSFKEGFLLGDQREFAQKSDANADDLMYLDRYLSDSNFFSKDLNIKHNVYSTGIGTSFIQPRTDIITNSSDIWRYKTLDEGYDADNDSPFIYECVDSKDNAVVYSSKIGQAGIGDVFCFNISKEINNLGEEIKIITVYTRDFTVKFNDQFEIIGDVIETPSTYKELPMVEHYINNSRIGVIEIVNDLLNGINTIVSNCVDNVVDTANQILVFLGCDISAEDVTAMLKAGAICIPPEGASSTPSVDKISWDLKYSEVNVLLEEIMARCYDIVGVPLASASTTGNGNNGAAYIGGGWTNAMTIIKRDILAFEASDRELLRKMLYICKQNPESKVNEISVNQVEIKYNINMTDNILSNTQALQNLVDCNMPFEHILKAIPIWGDTKTVSHDWQENVDRLKKEMLKEENGSNSYGNEEITQTVGQEANMDNP